MSSSGSSMPWPGIAVERRRATFVQSSPVACCTIAAVSTVRWPSCSKRRSYAGFQRAPGMKYSSARSTLRADGLSIATKTSTRRSVNAPRFFRSISAASSSRFSASFASSASAFWMRARAALSRALRNATDLNQASVATGSGFLPSRSFSSTGGAGWTPAIRSSSLRSIASAASRSAIRSVTFSSSPMRPSTWAIETTSRSTGEASARITRAPLALMRTVSRRAPPGRSGRR